MPPNYHNTNIYILYCKDQNIKDVYIGLTTDIKNRMAVHRRCTHNPANKSYSTRMYRFIRNTGGWENWCYKIIDEVICSSKKEAREHEKYWIKYLNPSLNTNN